MSQANLLPAVVLLALAASGCSTATPREPGPKVSPDAREWQRRSFPLPPIYMEHRSASGERWLMATPLYWKITGHERERYHLIPFFSYQQDRAAGRSWGQVLNYVWRRDTDGSFQTLFPIYWRWKEADGDSALYGPLYVSRKKEHERRRVLLFPWLYSRETADGYDYWGVLFRLVGRERQVFSGKARERLWLFFLFHIDLA